MKIHKLSEKAILMKLTIRRASLSRPDKVAQDTIQNELDDRSLTVMSRLFRDNANPIHQIMSEVDGIYAYHVRSTLPWVDKGPRILPNEHFMSYMEEMRGRIAKVDTLLAQHMPNYDQYVQQDIAYRSQGVNKRASVGDYPDAAKFQQSMSIDLKPYPLPDERHFLFDLPAEEEQAFKDMISDAEKLAREDAVKRMLTPLQKLAGVLAIPHGEEGGGFKRTTLDRILDGVEEARRLNMYADPEIDGMIRELTQTVGVYASRIDWLRDSPVVRKQAANKLADIADKMAGWMNGPITADEPEQQAA